MLGSTQNLVRDKLTTIEPTNCFCPVFFDATDSLGEADYWFEMRIGTFFQGGIKTVAALYGLDFSE
jgi:hypothetical protein